MENGFIIKSSRLNRNFSAKQEKVNNKTGKRKSHKLAYSNKVRNGWKRDLNL